jgi:hypothetical protein
MGMRTDEGGETRLVGAYGRCDGLTVSSEPSKRCSDIVDERFEAKRRCPHPSPSTTTLTMFSSAASDTDEPTYVSEKQRKATQRREALARLKDASSSRAARQPRFLGAEDDDGDDAAGGDVDFEQWERRDLAKRKRAPGGDSNAPSRNDPLLAGAFDDLFDLGETNGAAGEGKAEVDVDGTGAEGIDVEGGTAKKRRIVAKLDETRLLGPSGFPRLRDDIKKVKIKGKGHEVRRGDSPTLGRTDSRFAPGRCKT